MMSLIVELVCCYASAATAESRQVESSLYRCNISHDYNKRRPLYSTTVYRWKKNAFAFLPKSKMADYVEYVNHWKKKLEKGCDDQKVLAILHKLQKVPININLLQETGIGKTVRGLKSRQGEIGERAQNIYENWRKAVIDTSHQKGKEEQKLKKNINNVYKESSKQCFVENHKTSYTKHLSSVSNNAKFIENHHNSNKNDFQHQKKNKTSEYDVYMKQSSLLSTDCDNYLISNSNYLEEMEEDNAAKTSYPYLNKKSDKFVKNNYLDKKEICKQKSVKGEKLDNSSLKRGVNSDFQKKNKKLKTKLIDSKKESFNSSVASFEDILGLNDTLNVKRKKPVSCTQSVKKLQEIQYPTERSSTTISKKNKTNKLTSNKVQNASVNKSVLPSSPSVPEALKKSKLLPLEEVDILSTLPPIQPNYKPLPHKDIDNLTKKKRNTMSNEEAIMYTSSRRDRTAVYAGRRNHYLAAVPTLYEACVRVLIENVDALAYTGGVPYDILKPVLQRCNPMQLYSLEDYNPDLLEDTDELWEIHCKRDFRNNEPDEDETWRELYLRKFDERESKLKSVTANISASMAKASQVRQTKLAYVDSVAKPPRDVARRQAKHGTGLPTIVPIKSGQHPKISMPSNTSAVNLTSSTSSSSSSSSSSSLQPRNKPRVAPLMQKTLKLMKQHFRR